MMIDGYRGSQASGGWMEFSGAIWMITVLIDKIENLKQAIRDLDPERSEECEQVAELFSLLSSIITPLRVTKAERPDFIMEVGGSTTGIEVTWSCH